jgi:hypothetical protein
LIRSFILRLGFLPLVSLVSAPVFAAEPTGNPPETPVSEEAASEHEGVEATEKTSGLDAHKKYVDTGVQRASQWVDQFFSDPAYEAEAANSQLRIRPELYYREEQGAKAKLRVRARLNLPNLGRRVSLVAGAEDESGGFDDSVDDSSDDGIVGLQFFMKESSRWNTSITVGVKFNEFAFFAGPRVRYQNALGEKGSYRFTQTVRWQTNNKWQINTRLDLNRIITDRFFFRQTFDGRWRGEKAEEEGYRTQVSSFLTQRLGRQSGLQYEFSTIFHTRPDTHVDKYTVALRYRKRTRRDWLYYEIVPQLSFENEFGYRANPGIRLRLEFFYGADTVDQFWRRESEDSEDFRW